jgi:hypothetical protein
MRYVGTLSQLAGEYCILNDVSSDVLLGELASVDELFALAAAPQRLSLDPIEVRFKPADHDCVHRTEGANAAQSLADRAVSSGSATPAASSEQGTVMRDQRAIVIAFRGVQQLSSNGQSQLKFGLTKVLEWVPQAGSGLPVPSTSGVGLSTPGDVSARLTQQDPLWANRQYRESQTMRVSKMALAGVPARTMGTIGLDGSGLHIGW